MADPAEGVALPSIADLKKLPVEALIQKIADANRALMVEKQQSTRKDAEAAARLKLECDRLRAATSQHNRELEEQNTMLLKMLTKSQQENDKLKTEVTALQVRLDVLQAGRAAAQDAPGSVRALPPSQELPALPLAAAPELGTTPLAIAPGPKLEGIALPPRPPSSQAAPVPAQAQAVPQS